MKKEYALKKGQRSEDRFIRTTKRLLHELHWIRAEQVALEELEDQWIYGLDFFRIAFTALMGDRLIRLIRVFEESKRVASFWYLHRCEPKLIEKLLEDTGVRISDLRDLSKRLKRIRNKTFVHIDIDHVFDPTRVYKEEGIKPKDIQQAIEGLWFVLSKLYLDKTGDEFRYDEYSGKDILRLLELRDRDIDGDQ